MKKEKLDTLEKEVKEYLLKNIYAGFCKPFEIYHLDRPTIPETPGFRLWPNGLNEESIIERDDAWEKGLLELGLKHKVDLRLNHVLYIK
jgi:hypothetical protein